MSRAARRAFDALERRLARLAQQSPRLGIYGAGPLGALRNRLSRRWPGPEQIRDLFPGLDGRAAARVAWEIAGGEARNRLVVHWLRNAGLDPVRPLLRTPGIAGLAGIAGITALRPPAVLAMFHIGAVQATGAILERLPAPVLALRQGMLHATRPPLDLATTKGAGEVRAAAFQRALSYLTRGGFVALTADLPAGPGLPVSCLGRPLLLARGPFALARLTGAPIVPLAVRWRRGGLEAVTGQALDPATGSAPQETQETQNLQETQETALAAAAARWLESYLLTSPGDLGLGLLRALLSPPAGES